MNPDPTSLDRLHDLVMPPPVSWWPPAPAWYLVSAILLVVLVRLGYRSLAHWQHDRYRREALAELARHEETLRDPAQRAGTLSAIAELIKRTAITAFPREQTAGLTGSAWFAFLDRTTGGTSSGHGHPVTHPPSVGDCVKLAERAAYDPRIAADLQDARATELLAAVRRWLAHHQPEPVGGGRRYD